MLWGSLRPIVRGQRWPHKRQARASRAMAGMIDHWFCSECPLAEDCSHSSHEGLQATAFRLEGGESPASQANRALCRALTNTSQIVPSHSAYIYIYISM
jgi:hypothetical protein